MSTKQPPGPPPGRPPPPPPPRRRLLVENGAGEEEAAAILYAAERQRILRKFNDKEVGGTVKGAPRKPSGRGRPSASESMNVQDSTAAEKEPTSVERTEKEQNNKFLDIKEVDPLLALASDLQSSPDALYHDYEMDRDFLPTKAELTSNVKSDMTKGDEAISDDMASAVELSEIVSDVSIISAASESDDESILAAAADIIKSGKRRMTLEEQKRFDANVNVERTKSQMKDEAKSPEETLPRVDSLALFDAAAATVVEGSRRLSIERRKTVEAVIAKSSKNARSEEKVGHSSKGNEKYQEGTAGDEFDKDKTNRKRILDYEDDAEEVSEVNHKDDAADIKTRSQDHEAMGPEGTVQEKTAPRRQSDNAVNATVADSSRKSLLVAESHIHMKNLANQPAHTVAAGADMPPSESSFSHVKSPPSTGASGSDELAVYMQRLKNRKQVIRRVARKIAGYNAFSFSMNPSHGKVYDSSASNEPTSREIQTTAKYLRNEQSRISSRLHSSMRIGNMAMVDKLTRRMKKVSGDLMLVLDRKDEAMVGAVVASIKAGSGTSVRDNVPPHRVGAKWLESIRQQAVVRRSENLQEQFDAGTIKSMATLSPMLTKKQIHARWGNATVVGRGGLGRLASRSSISALEEEGAVRRVIPMPSIGILSEREKRRRRPQSAFERLTAMKSDKRRSLDLKGKRRRDYQQRQRPLSASLLGVADRKDDGTKNDGVMKFLSCARQPKNSKPEKNIKGREPLSAAGLATHIYPSPIPLTNPHSSRKFGGKLPGHARFEELQRQGSIMLDRLRKELRETRNDGIHTSGGNKLQDPAVGVHIQKLSKLYSSLYEGVHGSLNLMLDHMHLDGDHKKKHSDSTRGRKFKLNRIRRRKHKQRPKSALPGSRIEKSASSERRNPDSFSLGLTDGDNLSGIKDLRKSSTSVNRKRPKTAGLAGIRARKTGKVLTERSVCKPTRDNSMRREARRDQQYQAAIDKYRNYEYESGPRVEKGLAEGVFRVYN